MIKMNDKNKIYQIKTAELISLWFLFEVNIIIRIRQNKSDTLDSYSIFWYNKNAYYSYIAI